MDILSIILLWLIIPAIILCGVLVLKIIIARYFQEIAYEKGFEEKRYFWIPFLCGIIGYIMVAALPDRGNCCDE